ncbi:hypothetical protein [Nocardia mexicana]|uniref:hypothetical protein n=1 Tax=Nocardia mexicana TaxID=279262 RepID=UPI001476E351|nr:hypothetical protein [Nocardia mexicana]
MRVNRVLGRRPRVPGEAACGGVESGGLPDSGAAGGGAPPGCGSTAVGGWGTRFTFLLN